MKNVNALIIGRARSGTTSLYKILEFHPEICFSTIKEIHYFSVDDLYQRGINYYHSFFDFSAEKKQIIGADTYLFIDKEAPKRISEYNPEMKIIIMLREPVSAAFSGYNYAINNGYLKSKISFIESVQNEKQILLNSDIATKNNLCNLYQSMYFEHISFWMNYFSKEQILIIKTDDLKQNPDHVYSQLSDFLNVSKTHFSKSNRIENKSSKVKSKHVQQFLLNRNTPLRKFLRKIIPKQLKNTILHSGLIEKLSKLNKTETTYQKISSDEYQFAKNILETDLKNLKDNFAINFDNSII